MEPLNIYFHQNVDFFNFYVPFSKYGDQIEETETGGECSLNGRDHKYAQNISSGYGTVTGSCEHGDEPSILL
jgi:hypothetical protein